MADEQRKRLLFSNSWHQQQVTWKLYDCVLNKIAPGSVLNNKSVEIPELNLLWEMIEDPSEAVSRLCSHCLVQLVSGGHAEFDFILTRFLNVMPSARNLNGIIEALSHLLILQAYQCTKSGTEYKCPFSLWSTPHPFITVLISRPDYATHLIQHVNLILVNSVTAESCLEPKIMMQMLESFFKFVLQDPKVSVTQIVRQQLFTGLLQTASTVLRCPGENSNYSNLLAKHIVHFLMSTMPSYQIGDKFLIQTTFLVHSLANWLLEHKDIFNTDVTGNHFKVIVNHLLSLCCESLSHGCDMTTSLHLLQTIQHYYPQAFSQFCVIPTLSSLLLSSPQDYHIHIMQLCLSILQTQNPNSITGCQYIAVSHVLLVLPILQVITSPPRQTAFSVWTTPSSQSIGFIAVQILRHVEVHILPMSRQLKHEKESLIVPEACEYPCSVLSQYIRQMTACLHQLIALVRNEEMAKCWLESLQSSILSQGQVLSHVTLMLSALLVTSGGCVVMETLNVIPVLAKTDPSQALYFLPLLLYKLGKEVHPEVKHSLLYTIPQLATHKFCIGPVLRTIQTIGQSPNLKAVSLRLMCKLWQSQNRVFPHLQRVLNTADTYRVASGSNLEIQIAKAACLLDICKERPSQHGADLLSLLSKLLDQNTKPGETGNHSSVLVVTLALQALEQLCKAEVVDLCTAWKVVSVKLSLDRRPAVLCSLCQLFSTVPSLATSSQDYQDFKNHVLSFLWSLTEHQESLVSCAAFAALSQFDPSDFKLIHLPTKIYHPLKVKLLASKTLDRNVGDEEEDMAAVEESIDNSTPQGSAYVELLQTINQQAHTGFQKLLTSMIRREAGSLPRGLAHTVSRAAAFHDRNLQSIPGLLMSQYEKSKTPGLTQGLAAGLLFSFEPPFEEHQGKRVRRYLVNCARRYRQMLESLLHEVPVQPSEWHRTLLMPQAWSAFMVRAYQACVEGRKAELEMQHSHGHIQDTEELKTKQMNSWLWVRDQMTEQLKTASRGSPSVQGNSVFALAGLARAVSLFVQQQNSSGETSQGQRITDWLTMVTDTIMVVLDGNYKPKGPTLIWCQQVSSPTSTASSLLARSCAALSLSLLVPSLITLDTDRIHNMTKLLKQRIPGQAKPGGSVVVQMSCSLGLGLLLSRLYEEHFSDLCGKEGYLLVTTALDALENAALVQELENTEGACLGLGLALSFLCKESVVDSRVHVTNTYHKLMNMLDEYSADQRLQSLCFSVALVCVNAFYTGLLSADEAEKCAEKIQKLSNEHLETCGISLSLGLLFHGLVSCGFGGVVQLAKQQGDVWRSILESKDASYLQQLAALNGVIGLLGSEQSLFIMDSSIAVEVFPSSGGSIIKYLQQIISRPEDVGLSSNAAWLLSHLYTASTSSAVSKSRVPSNFGYLSEGSMLRLLFDFLVQAGKTGPHLSFSGKVVPVVLESLVSGPQVALPPVNWASVLGPIMRANFDEETSQLCIELAVNQAQSSSSLSSFLSSLLSPEVFMGLGNLCKKKVLENLPRLVYVISSSKMKQFYEGVLTMPWKNKVDRALCSSILEAHLSVLKLKEPPPSVIGWTITALQHMYNACTEDATDHVCLSLLARCLTLISVEDLERVVHDTQTIATKALVVRCMAVSERRVSVKWLTPCIEWILTADVSEMKRKEFLCCVVGAIIDSDHKRKSDDRLHWFLELIGQYKNAVQHSLQASTHKIFLNCLTTLSMISAALCTVPLLQGLVLSSRTEPTVGQTAENCRSLERLSWLLPLTLSTLLGNEPWSQITGKMLDWLLSLRDNPTVQTHPRQRALIQDTIISMRETDTFKKTAVWTDVIARFHFKWIEQDEEQREK